jgi:hypothetical protein
MLSPTGPGRPARPRGAGTAWDRPGRVNHGAPAAVLGLGIIRGAGAGGVPACHKGGPAGSHRAGGTTPGAWWPSRRSPGECPAPARQPAPGGQAGSHRSGYPAPARQPAPGGQADSHKVGARRRHDTRRLVARLIPTGWVSGDGTTPGAWWPGRPTPAGAGRDGLGPVTPPRAVGWRAGLGRHSNRGKSGYSSVSVARGCGRGRESCPLPPNPLTERSPNTTDDQPEPPPAAGLRTPPWPHRIAPARAAKRTGQTPCGCHHD